MSYSSLISSLVQHKIHSVYNRGHSRDDKPIIIPLKSKHVGNLFRLVPIEILLFNSFCFEATLRIVKLA